MIEALLSALITFAVTFLILRGLEWAFHRYIRHNRDYSPHWGTWVFALLLAIYALISNLGV
jgi:hypothetical protein